MKILIICTGNSCRSQMAWGFLRSFDKDLEVYSAGTEPAIRVHPLAVEVMSEIGIDLSQQVPVSVNKYTGRSWDYVITVCGGANENCPVFLGKVKHRIHIGFDDPSHVEGTEGHIRNEFIRVRDEIKDSFYKLYLEQIKPQSSQNNF